VAEFLPAGRQGYTRNYELLCLCYKINDNKYYKGYTNNLDRRITEHVNRKTKSIKSYKYIKLIHVEICNSLEKALRLEKYFKSGSGREIINEIADVAELVYAHA
jgi:putative endonuclease